MSQFSQKNMAGNIRSLLAINSTDLPKLQPIETLLWSAVQNALVNADDLIVELEWLGLGAQLSNILKKANAEVIGKLSETAICSFRSEISEESFLTHFGRHEEWHTLQADVRINYFRARFASIYWCSVRDFAVKSKRDCMSIFHLPWSLIEVLSESSTSQIIDFCHGYPLLQRFRLMCSPEDCVRIANVVNQEMNPTQQYRLLLGSKMVKTNHCVNACLHTRFI